MDGNKENTNKLLSLYAENRISPMQLKELREDIENLSDEELFNALSTEWERNLANESPVNIPDLTKLSQRIQKKTSTNRQKYTISIWSTVAAIAAIFILVFLFTRNGLNNDTELEQIVATLNNVSNKTEEIQLILDTGNTIEIERGSTVAYQKNGTICVNEKMVGESRTSEANDNKYNRLLVPNGKYTYVILSDGTKMHVNAGTKVVYPITFSDKRREIYVDGEVSLDVTPDNNCPFIVKTTSFDVQVLGTTFNVNAYSNSLENKEVVLACGKVNVTTKTGKELTLYPNHKATVLLDGNITKSNVDAEEYMFWIKGILFLKDEPLHSLLIRLNRYYDVDIRCSTDIAAVNINGKVDLECTIDEVLKRISTTGGFSYSKRDNVYMLAPFK